MVEMEEAEEREAVGKKQQEEEERNREGGGGGAGYGTLHAGAVLEIYFRGSFKLTRVILEDESCGKHNFLIITLSIVLINKRIKDKLKFTYWTYVF